MPKTRLISPGSIANHTLSKNLQLNDKFISNDGGDEGLNVKDDGTIKILPSTKASSLTADASLWIQETLNLGSGEAGGNDNHYGIYYRQIQTDIAGWDGVYLMYLAGNLGRFAVDSKGQAIIDIDDSSTITAVNRGLHIDIDSTGDLGSGSQTLTNIGLDLDIDRPSTTSHGSATVSQTGIDIDIVGETDGASTNTGINITVSHADTNYALITSGGNVGIGVADPDQALEVNGNIHVENTVYFSAETANTIGNGATGAIDWNTSQKQKVTITGTGITCNFTNPPGACNLLLKVVQGDGSDVISAWDGDIKWAGGSAPTLSTGNGEIDILSFYFDGTNYFGVASLAFATP